jgi:hypothetical protein
MPRQIAKATMEGTMKKEDHINDRERRLKKMYVLWKKKPGRQ